MRSNLSIAASGERVVQVACCKAVLLAAARNSSVRAKSCMPASLEEDNGACVRRRWHAHCCSRAPYRVAQGSMRLQRVTHVAPTQRTQPADNRSPKFVTARFYGSRHGQLLNVGMV
jgi:hypothetical protein